ncbi:MAG: DUF3887 domain-containing protein [Cyanobacteriota bacterium]|jgi:hypothetical protein
MSTPPLPERLRPWAWAMALALPVALLGPRPVSAQSPGVMPQAMPVARPQPSSALTEQRAREAAGRILEALRSGSAASRYEQFAPSLQRMTSPAMVQAQISRLPRLIGWHIGTIQPGVDSSMVDAHLVTSAGRRDLTMVIDANGRLEAYHFDVSDKPAEELARRFVQALIEGRFVLAGGLLSAETQLEIPASMLQAKWQTLQRSTGQVRGIQKVFRAEDTSDMKLILVTTRFNRLTDNLYIIMDRSNQIIGVDFPTDQPGGSKASTPR